MHQHRCPWPCARDGHLDLAGVRVRREAVALHRATQGQILLAQRDGRALPRAEEGRARTLVVLVAAEHDGALLVRRQCARVERGGATGHHARRADHDGRLGIVEQAAPPARRDGIDGERGVGEERAARVPDVVLEARVEVVDLRLVEVTHAAHHAVEVDRHRG